MRKTWFLLSFIFLLALITTVSASAAQPEYKIIVNGKQVEFPDAKPFADEASRIQVPVRFIAEALGIDVAWDQDTQTVEFYKFDDYRYTFYLTITLGQDWYTLSGIHYEMDTVAIAKDGRVYAPIRYVAQAFGVGVQWDSQLNAVVLGGEPDPNDMPKIKYFPVETTGGYKFTTETSLRHVDHYGIGGKAVTFEIDYGYVYPAETERQINDFRSIIENSDINKASNGVHLSKAEELLQLLAEGERTPGTEWYVSWIDEAVNEVHVLHAVWKEREVALITLFLPGFDPRQPHDPDVRAGDGINALSINKYHTVEELTKALEPYSLELFRSFGEYLKNPDDQHDRFSAFLDQHLSDQEDDDPRDNRELSEAYFEGGKFLLEQDGVTDTDATLAKIGDALLGDLEMTSEIGFLEHTLYVYHRVFVTVDGKRYGYSSSLGFYPSDEDPERMVLIQAHVGRYTPLKW